MRNFTFKYSLPRIHEAAEFVLKNTASKFFLFQAPMGAGKTTLIGEIIKKISPDEFLGSPTFSLVNEYRTFEGKPFYHFDLYRLNTAEELLDIGFEDYLDNAEYLFIEWPEKAEEYMPETYDLIQIKPVGTNKRILEITTS